MNENLNTATAIIKKATDTLIVFNPRGTGVGLAFGGLIKVIVKLYDPFLTAHNFGSLNDLNPIFLLLSGIFIFNISTILKKNRLNSELESTLTEIEISLKKGLITKTQARMHYNAIMAEHIKFILIRESADKDIQSD